MKLVELLARELSEWPECVSITQDCDGDVGLYSISNPTTFGAERAVWKFGGHIRNIAHLRRVASDHATAIVTRADWTAERARIAKPAEHVESCSKPDPRDSAKRDSDYVCWMRDRITEIDATTQALTSERAELVKKLASDGFALIGRAADPVEDYGNIQIGDLVSVIGIGGFADCTGLSVGDIVEVTSVDNDESLKTVPGGSWGSIGYNYKFHSRPSA